VAIPASAEDHRAPTNQLRELDMGEWIWTHSFGSFLSRQTAGLGVAATEPPLEARARRTSWSS
jgi:hypothetical protein